MLHLHVHPTHPQTRAIARAVDLLRAGGLAIYPTDTTYGLGCDLFARRSFERIYRLRGLQAAHPLSLLCGDLSEVDRYAVVENHNFRLLRRHLPGKYTFVLPARRETPRAAQGDGRTVGIRIPDHPVPIALIRALGHPVITTTAGLPAAAAVDADADADDDAMGQPLRDPDAIVAAFGRQIEGFLDVGELEGEPSSVIDLTGPTPRVLRAGSGDVSWVT